MVEESKALMRAAQVKIQSSSTQWWPPDFARVECGTWAKGRKPRGGCGSKIAGIGVMQCGAARGRGKEWGEAC
jgi:hypothetical protein